MAAPLWHTPCCSHPVYVSLLPAIRDILRAIRQRKRVDEVVEMILESSCALANAVHGSFVTVDPLSQKLSITNTFGADWTPEKQLCQLRVGQGLTGKVAATGLPYLCNDVTADPEYFPLFDYVRSELIVPVFVDDRVWGLINMDGLTTNAFDDETLSLLTVFAELAAFAITLRLELTEQEKLQKKLMQSEKLASLGEAIAGIAHEINNPLTSVLGHASLLTFKRGGASDDASIQAIMNESMRAADLVKSLLEFTRKETGKLEVVNFNDLIRQVVGIKKFQLKVHKVEMQVFFEEDPMYVHVCPQQIQQVLMNLLSNAEQSISRECNDGLIRIQSSRNLQSVLLRVEDNGKGIPADAQKFIFDPFFTTKAPGDGTGLGLSIAYSIMETHGGAISLASSSSVGSTFMLELPLASHPSPTGSPHKEPEKNSRLRGRILLVDDEPQILESVGRYLEMQQIEVIRAGDGLAALEVLHQHKFDLILSDVRMPGLDGMQLYDRARELESRYEKNFIFMSGFFIKESVKSFVDATGCAYLEKPFSFEDLRRAIVKCLGELSAPASQPERLN
jgi:signal transduction histidine kinase/CheY-like chemotaxis protein